jgi:UDP-N-acetylmuramoyl-L-alanyl-D-glutamate--2,6-diaminopimelate ligase
MNVAGVHTLRSLTHGVGDQNLWPEIEITGLSLDSRSITPGDLFLAVPGLTTDGRRYIDQSLAAGAAAVLAEAPLGNDPSGVDERVFEVENLHRHLGTIADRFYRQPSRHLCVIGVTGTNGKTTCSHILAQSLAALGVESGVLGTIGNGRPDALTASTLTTADAVGVQRELRKLHDDGVRFVCMEVSSHALDQGRVDKVAFDFAVFTNLTQDHLDYHDDMESYGRAKARLFALQDLSACVINVDDAFGRRLAEGVDMDLLWSYGESSDARVRRDSLALNDGVIAMSVIVDDCSWPLEVPLIGHFNADNALAVFTTLLAMGYDPSRASTAMRSVRAVPGRMESFTAEDRARVIVDYAHTPDALEKALLACRESGPRALWVVFGCGGDRDRSKRALMGAVAARLADHVVLTNDNPRGEQPLSIIQEIQAGLDGRETVITDRREAIAHAIRGAGAGDIVLVAGKGHETGQIEAGVTRPFSDRDTVRELLGGEA